MTPTIRNNFRSEKQYTAEMWRCPGCRDPSNTDTTRPDTLDTQQHVQYTCPAYSDLREDKDFDKDGDLVEFFRQVIERRMENDGK